MIFYKIDSDNRFILEVFKSEYQHRIMLIKNKNTYDDILKRISENAFELSNEQEFEISKQQVLTIINQ